MENFKVSGLNRISTEKNLNSFHSGDSFEQMQPLQGQGYQKKIKPTTATLRRQKSVTQTKQSPNKPKQNERSKASLYKFLQELANYSVYEFENFMAIMQTS